MLSSCVQCKQRFIVVSCVIQWGWNMLYVWHYNRSFHSYYASQRHFPIPVQFSRICMNWFPIFCDLIAHVLFIHQFIISAHFYQSVWSFIIVQTLFLFLGMIIAPFQYLASCDLYCIFSNYLFSCSIQWSKRFKFSLMQGLSFELVTLDLKSSNHFKLYL